jgi:hypothetical protein
VIGTWTPPPGAEPLLEVEVYGENVPAGSKVGRVVRFKNEQGKWRIKRWLDPKGNEQAQVTVSDTNSTKLEKRAQVIQAAVLDASAEQGFKMPHKDRPLAVVVTFYRQRSRTVHYGSGRNERVLKDSAPAYPISAPDTTKLWRGFEDALTGFVWHDDSRVTGQIADEDFVHWWEEPWTGFALYGLPATVGERRAAQGDVDLGPQASLL